MAYGAGSMKERSPGVWRLRAFVGRDPLTGNPVQAHQTLRGSEKDARKALAKMVADVEGGKLDRTTATVGQLLDRWLEHIASTRRPSTLAGYRSKIEHTIRPALGEKRLSKLGPDDLDRCYQAWLAAGLSTSTVRQLHAIISAALHQAERWGWVDRSVARRASPPAARSAPMKVPTPEQLTTLIRTAEGDDPLLASAIALAALTGARRGELCALRWSDIDLEAGVVRIERAITVIGGETHIGPTKTHQVRRAALDEVGVALLRRRWEQMAAISTHADSPLTDDPFVLSPNANGARTLNPDSLTHRFSALCRRLEKAALEELRHPKPKATNRDLPAAARWPFRFHDLRHFSVTTLIAAGVDVRTVAERHGHAQAIMTLNRYAHALPERDRAAASVLGGVLQWGGNG
jgi:integrase